MFVLVPQEFPEGPQEVPDVRTFRGISGDVPGTSRAGWIIAVDLSREKELDVDPKAIQ